MDQGFTYGIDYLDDAYSQYLKTFTHPDKELASFYDGFRLAISTSTSSPEEKEAYRLLNHFRHFGYISADTNPLFPAKGDSLTLINNQVNPDGLVSSFWLFDEDNVPLKVFQEKLSSLYTGSVGYQFIHCDKPVIDFILSWIENPTPHTPYLNSEQIFEKLAESELLEKFLHSRFPGQKRFSLEGLETAMVFLEEVLAGLQKKRYTGAFLGMAHRGRLNVLSHLFKKPYSAIFEEFSQTAASSEKEGLGDVKYHKGASYKTSSGFELYLSSNPSHLESVDPVVVGMCYSDRLKENKKSLPLLIHGDASFAGQGVVYETLQLSKLKGFDAGGCLHLILNNQIGFTALPSESRSTPEPTDLAKAFNIPIFHIHSEDVEAIQKIALLSLELIERFKIDVVINLIGYRKWGHNESDEPSFTQPLLYAKIKDRSNTLLIYKRKLLEKEPSLEPQLDLIEKKILDTLQDAFQKPYIPESSNSISPESRSIKLDASLVKTAGLEMTTVPTHLHVHPKIKKLYEERHEAIQNNGKIDWALAELLSFSTLLKQGSSLRLIGQDSQRGTFSQRHAILVDQENETRYNVFEKVVQKGAFCDILNSCLSEYAVLGFEFGFNKIATNTLCLWEAQFGDFVNGAQIIIDQYIASSKTKWNESSSLTLLLPHGYEGQGPEHTSARIERFLELGAEDNMQICIPTTPSQLFHLLINQINAQKPLILFTPKMLLRHPMATSDFKEFTEGTFNPILDDGNMNASVIVLCYGRIYFDLLEKKEKKGLSHISLIRLERLYPLNIDDLKRHFENRNGLKKVVLIQDEPLNMGAYTYLKALYPELSVIARKSASSPAAGYYSLHKKEQESLLTQFENL